MRGSRRGQTWLKFSCPGPAGPKVFSTLATAAAHALQKQQRLKQQQLQASAAGPSSTVRLSLPFCARTNETDTRMPVLTIWARDALDALPNCKTHSTQILANLKRSP